MRAIICCAIWILFLPSGMLPHWATSGRTLAPEVPTGRIFGDTYERDYDGNCGGANYGSCAMPGDYEEGLA